LSTIEVILPLRNPPTVLQQSVESLALQTDRSFSVLISDNYSTKGGEIIGAAVSRLEGVGIRVRRVKPPFELGRVEHWNWAHHESTGDWLKPVFAGDWLENNYIARLREVVAANSECRYIFCNYVLHPGNNPTVTISSPWAGRFRPAAEMELKVLSYGMQFGPPSAAAIEKNAFISMGGYPTPLPICSDSLMFCTLAMRYGVYGIADPLCHFNIHDSRFSTTLPGKRRDTFRETMTFSCMLAYRAWAAGVSFSKVAFARLLLRETRAYCAQK
jgi:glycosyltransferase involved in cell wall biosynthesis